MAANKGYPCLWWNSPKRMELDCRVCGKAYGRGADQPSKCVEVFSSPIIHNLFNDSSWCNEQSHLGEKVLPSPGIEPKTFRFPCRRSNHWATRLGWLNKEKLLHTTMLGLSTDYEQWGRVLHNPMYKSMTKSSRPQAQFALRILEFETPCTLGKTLSCHL